MAGSVRPDGRERRWTLAVLLALAVATLAAWPDLVRAGYSPDEEFTLFAVRGIEAHGLPLLPSGLLYDRGLGYSYAAWLAGLVAGQTLPVFRAVSVLSALLSLWVIYRELARLASPPTACLAVVAVAASVPFWVSASTARFYAPFLLCDLIALALLARPALSTRGAVALALVAFGARWTHELAFTLAGVPAVAFVFAAPGRRVEWLRRGAWLIAGLVAGQLALFAVHALAPPTNGDVMVRRFFLWQVLNLFERPPLDLPRLLPVAALAGVVVVSALAFVRGRQQPWSGATALVGGIASMLGQLGLAPVVAVAALPLATPRIRQAVVGTSLVVLAGALLFWMVAAMAAGFAPTDAWARVTESAFDYPLDMFAHLVSEFPLLTGLTLAALLARSAGAGGPWTAVERALHVLWIGWVLWFGVIESGITARYLLLPVTFMLTALAVDAGAIAAARAVGARRLVAVAGVVAVLLVTGESWRGGSAGPPWEGARPTLATSAAAPLVEPTDLIAGPDELACLLVANRIDAWLVLDEFFRERFIVMRGGQPTGTYTGAPAASALLPLLERAEREGRRLIVVDAVKDVPGFGSSVDLVPRQLARENLRGEVLTPPGPVRLVRIVRALEDTVARR
ncbi:MAG: glycosyltransferase family 39 protein [Acidobacteria bacterium]|nr:glycosyltransferase family 39 protein [Acidobacteriota bacterium]